MVRNPSRRDLFAGRLSAQAGHIASLMVQARPERIDHLTPSLNAIRGVEVHGSNDRGRMVVTVEAVDDGHLMQAISRIEAVDGVVAASLVYHQIED